MPRALRAVVSAIRSRLQDLRDRWRERDLPPTEVLYRRVKALQEK